MGNQLAYLHRTHRKLGGRNQYVSSMDPDASSEVDADGNHFWQTHGQSGTELWDAC